MKKNHCLFHSEKWLRFDLESMAILYTRPWWLHLVSFDRWFGLPSSPAENVTLADFYILFIYSPIWFGPLSVPTFLVGGRRAKNGPRLSIMGNPASFEMLHLGEYLWAHYIVWSNGLNTLSINIVTRLEAVIVKYRHILTATVPLFDEVIANLDLEMKATKPCWRYMLKGLGNSPVKLASHSLQLKMLAAWICWCYRSRSNSSIADSLDATMSFYPVCSVPTMILACNIEQWTCLCMCHGWPSNTIVPRHVLNAATTLDWCAYGGMWWWIRWLLLWSLENYTASRDSIDILETANVLLTTAACSPTRTMDASVQLVCPDNALYAESQSEYVERVYCKVWEQWEGLLCHVVSHWVRAYVDLLKTPFFQKLLQLRGSSDDHRLRIWPNAVCGWPHYLMVAMG